MLDSYTQSVSNNLAEIYGTELQAQVVRYQGYDVGYQYQLWKIREQSVCAGYKSRLEEYSACSHAASRMFNEICQELQKKPHAHWKYRKTKNMYCTVAVGFKPTTAFVRKSKPLSKLEKAKQECSQWTVAALGASEPDVLSARKKACGDYKKLKSEENQIKS